MVEFAGFLNESNMLGKCGIMYNIFMEVLSDVTGKDIGGGCAVGNAQEPVS